MSRYIRRCVQDVSSFTCIHCGFPVSQAESGTRHRNHCPYCLWSLHVDLKIGDRRSRCRQPMEPISLWVKKNGEVSIIHRCTGCGFLRHNRLASDDNEEKLIALAHHIKRSLPALNGLSREVCNER